jgi:hypothetical protein
MNKFLCCLLTFLFSMQMQSVAQSTSQLWKVDDVVSWDTLGLTQKYVEFKIGSPAMTEFTSPEGIQINRYEIGKCIVSVGFKKGTTVSVGTEVSANCDPDVSKYFRVPGVKLSQTTFENWEQLSSQWHGQVMHFVDPIQDHCNSCEEEVGVSAIFLPCGGNGDLGLRLWGKDYGDQVFSKGLDVWKEKLHQAGIDGGQLYEKRRFKGCPQEAFDEDAYRLMGKGKIWQIEISRRAGEPVYCP